MVSLHNNENEAAQVTKFGLFFKERFLLDFVMGPQFPEEERNNHLNEFYQKHIDYKKGIIKYGKEVVSVPDSVAKMVWFCDLYLITSSHYVFKYDLNI